MTFLPCLQERLKNSEHWWMRTRHALWMSSTHSQCVWKFLLTVGVARIKVITPFIAFNKHVIKPCLCMSVGGGHGGERVCEVEAALWCTWTQSLLCTELDSRQLFRTSYLVCQWFWLSQSVHCSNQIWICFVPCCQLALACSVFSVICLVTSSLVWCNRSKILQFFKVI